MHADGEPGSITGLTEVRLALTDDAGRDHWREDNAGTAQFDPEHPRQQGLSLEPHLLNPFEREVIRAYVEGSTALSCPGLSNGGSLPDRSGAGEELHHTGTRNHWVRCTPERVRPARVRRPVPYHSRVDPNKPAAAVGHRERSLRDQPVRTSIPGRDVPWFRAFRWSQLLDVARLHVHR